LCIIATLGVAGCRVDKVTFNRFQEGKKFLAADQPFQAMDYFQESLKRSAEKDTAPVAKAYYAVAVARAADKVGPTHPDHAKYTALLNPALDAIRNEPESLRGLVNLLANHDLSSQSAANLCVQLGASISSILLEGYDTYPQIRKDVLAILEHIGTPAVPDVVKSAQNTTLPVELRLDLVRLLGTIGGAEAQQALVTIAKDVSRGIQVEAIAALYRTGDKSQREAILAALDDPDVEARRAAANATVFLNETPNVNVLVSHLKDPDATVRLGLVSALGKHVSGAEGANALIRVIQKDPNTDVANAAVPALSKYGPSIVSPVLDALVSERDWPRRQRLVQVLKDPTVKTGFNQDLEYRLYEFYEKKETQPNLKAELAELLKSLEK
jgi:HEAT repeat protein